jgi:hypothetical protein
MLFLNNNISSTYNIRKTTSLDFDLIEILVLLGARLLVVLEMVLLFLHHAVHFYDVVRVSLDTTIYGLVSSLTIVEYLLLSALHD